MTNCPYEFFNFFYIDAIMILNEGELIVNIFAKLMKIRLIRCSLNKIPIQFLLIFYCWSAIIVQQL